MILNTYDSVISNAKEKTQTSRHAEPLFWLFLDGSKNLLAVFFLLLACVITPGIENSRELNSKPARLQTVSEGKMEKQPDVDVIIEKLLEVRGQRPGKYVNLEEAEIKFLCTRAREIFFKQPMLLELEAPIKICGELHSTLICSRSGNRA
jgi:hypothetical protein